MLKRIIKVPVTIMMLLVLCLSFAGAAVKDDWQFAYAPGMPSYLYKTSDIVTVTYYGGGHIAKATYLQGTSDRMVHISANSPAVITPFNITVANVLTAPWNVTGSYVNVIYTASGVGSSCQSTGWIYINDPSIYNS